jgi:hypothetical protein
MIFITSFSFYNNTCVLPAGGATYWIMGSYDCSTPTIGFTVTMGNNSIYAPNADVTISCSGSLTFAEFEASGLDPGTAVYDSPSIETMLQWGCDVLGIVNSTRIA